jgi:non-heme chloroperoxidase
MIMKRTQPTSTTPIAGESRRQFLLGSASLLAACSSTNLSTNETAAARPEQRSGLDHGRRHMATIKTQDGTELYYKDWGSGRPVVFSHGWPLSSDSWESQMLFLAERGYRCIAHDRRGHGRSSQPWNGNDMDTYADDLATVIESLGLDGITLVGFSTGGGEISRYIGRHGTRRVCKRR